MATWGNKSALGVRGHFSAQVGHLVRSRQAQGRQQDVSQLGWQTGSMWREIEDS